MARTAGTSAERRERDRRIVAASQAGEPVEAIAEAEHVSIRTVRRTIADRSPHVTVEPLPETIRIDPAREIGHAITIRREACERLRQIAANSRNEAVAIGASKAVVDVNTALLNLLSQVGLLPQSPTQWRSELVWRATWERLFDELHALGIDPVALMNQVEGTFIEERTELAAVRAGAAFAVNGSG